MMCVATDYAVVCLDSIDDVEEREQVCHILRQTGKEIIAISEEQMHHFAGNMLQVENGKGALFLVMSQVLTIRWMKASYNGCLSITRCFPCPSLPLKRWEEEVPVA